MYKNIIPGLVSFDTNLNTLNGFLFSDNFLFYKEVDKPAIFHYKILKDNKISIPSNYEFKNGYYLKSGDDWFYCRKLLGFIPLVFKYNEKTKIFSFNNIYSFIPFKLGGISPIGEQLANIVSLELFLNRYLVFFGCAFSYKNENICLIAPSFNGKSFFMNSIIKRGAKYIAEDVVVLNIEKKELFPVSCRKYNYGRKIFLKSKSLLDNIVDFSVPINKLVFAKNFTSSQILAKEKYFIDYLFLNSLLFLSNTFTKSFIFENNLTKLIIYQINFLKTNQININFINIKNYNYEEILR